MMEYALTSGKRDEQFTIFLITYADLELFYIFFIGYNQIYFRDFNPEENVSEKLRKVNEIKDSRGLRKFIKETLNASTGKIAHDLLGSVEIPLKVFP